MSKQADQTLVRIATIAGCLETFRKTNAFSRVDIRRGIDKAFSACETAILQWPGIINKYWVEDKRKQFFSFVENTPDVGYSSAALACMCERVITDLLDDNEGLARKMALLQPIADVCRDIHNFIDPDGKNFPAYGKSDELIDELDRILEITK